ncbi:MAG: c-type cytochrome [Proteobacteria bacterium]|nr:c-type cytochrome [Pseudomonadota bacterium]
MKSIASRMVAMLSMLSIAALATASPAKVDKPLFHNDRQRSGWNAQETVLTPQAVATGNFGPIWQSPQFDSFGDVPPRLFASLLYLGSVAMPAGPFAGKTLALAYAVTSTGYAYAVAASPVAAPAPGTIIWRAQLTAKPCDGGTSGNLATPAIDRAANRLYVTSCDDDKKWQVHALDIRDGKEAAGWPLTLDAAALNAPGINRNSGNQFSDTRTIIQRGALNLSADNARLYIPIGPDSAGWLVVVDTRLSRVASAFSSTAKTEEDQGGMWASGGASVDGEGRVYIATGSKFLARARKGVAGIYPDSEHDWGQSLLQFRDDREAGLTLVATYSPFNYCQAGAADIDLGSSGTAVIDLPADASGTPHLLTVGGKQGNLYLLDRDRLPGGTTKRHACSTDPDTDGSLLAPDPQPQFGLRGPLNLFGPYSDYVSMLDQAKSRSTPAWYRDAAGKTFIFATGSAKTGDDFSTSAPPGLARVAVVAAPGQPAFLQVDALEKTQIFENAGSPVVSSAGGAGAIVWVLDPHAPRTAPLYGAQAPKPVLYAFDAATLKLLWKSRQGELFTSGKYNEPAVVDGMALVGTDRVQAFGLRPGPRRAAAVVAPVKRATAGAPAPVRLNAAPPQAKPATGDQAIAAGRTIFQARCNACHGSRQPGTPSRADLAKLSQAQIVEILLHGPMRPMAAGLSKDDVGNVAKFLSTRK